MKIGVINITSFLDNSPKGQTLSHRLKNTAQQWENKLEAIRNQLSETEKKLSKTPETSLAEVRLKLLREQELAQMEHRHVEERMRFDIESQRNQFRNQLLSELEPHIEALAKNNELDIVLTAPHPALAYVNPSIDLTPAILEIFDQSKKS